MRIEALGHVVIRVRDLERSVAFYHELLGIPISARAPEWSMVLFTLGEHHDFAIAAVDPASSPDETTLGLDHFAFQLSGGLDALREARAELAAAGVPAAGFDHTVTKSLYFQDPDGNRVELYVNTTEAWRDDPSLILAEGGPLEL
ncbi:MAG: VOC family protein [Myxococcota bacterium]